jgi:hypothetical protein
MNLWFLSIEGNCLIVVWLKNVNIYSYVKVCFDYFHEYAIFESFHVIFKQL